MLKVCQYLAAQVYIQVGTLHRVCTIKAIMWSFDSIGKSNRFLTGYNVLYTHVLMRDEKEGRKKQARSNKQQGEATQHMHSRQSRKMSCLGWDSNPRHSTLYI